MLAAIIVVCLLSAAGMIALCIGFGHAAHGEASAIECLGVDDAAKLRLRLVKRIRERRRTKREPPEKSVSLRYGMTTWNIRVDR